MSRPRISGLIDERLRLVLRSNCSVRLRPFFSKEDSEVYDSDEDLDLRRLLRSTPLWKDIDRGSLFCWPWEAPLRRTFEGKGEDERERRVEMVETEVDE